MPFVTNVAQGAPEILGGTPTSVRARYPRGGWCGIARR